MYDECNLGIEIEIEIESENENVCYERVVCIDSAVFTATLLTYSVFSISFCLQLVFVL